MASGHFFKEITIVEDLDLNRLIHLGAGRPVGEPEQKMDIVCHLTTKEILSACKNRGRDNKGI